MNIFLDGSGIEMEAWQGRFRQTIGKMIVKLGKREHGLVDRGAQIDALILFQSKGDVDENIKLEESVIGGRRENVGLFSH